MAQAAAKQVRSSIEKLRSKRQRVAEPESVAACAPAGPERPPLRKLRISRTEVQGLLARHLRARGSKGDVAPRKRAEAAWA